MSYTKKGFAPSLQYQDHKSINIHRRRSLTFILFPYCSPSPSLKSDDIAWGVPLQVNNALSAWTVEGTTGWDAGEALDTLFLCSTVSNYTNSNNPVLSVTTFLNNLSCSCALPMQCKYFPASAEKQGLNGLRTKLLPHIPNWVLLGWVLRNKRDFKLLLSQTFSFDGEIRFQSYQSGTSCQHGVYFLGQ